MVNPSYTVKNGGQAINRLHIHVDDNQHIRYERDHIIASYTYRDTIVEKSMNGSSNGFVGQSYIVKPVEHSFQIKTDIRIPRLGVMLVGWGGNNGATLTAALLAHKNGISWRTKNGIQEPNFYGSLMMAGTMRLGIDSSLNSMVNVPFNKVLPMVDPKDILIGGWDISSCNLAQAMEASKVLEPDLQAQLYSEMEKMKPLPSIYHPSFIAANQSDRANNILPASMSMQDQLERIRKDIKFFKEQNKLEKVIVLWTATTERCVDYNSDDDHGSQTPFPSSEFQTFKSLSNAIKNGMVSKDHVAPSLLFAIAAVLEGCPFLNGSPQNTLSCPAIQELSIDTGVPIGGDDFKSGQTKLKSVLVDFLIGAGIKPIAITSYNHLGNNDGKNLSAPPQFRSKEISKSNVVDDMVASNNILYSKNETPDHVVVIKYVPSVGDSKRAMDEYESEIFMGGRNTISIHNTCEDSLLAAPILLDLVLLTDLLTRIHIRKLDHRADSNNDVESANLEPMHPILSLLSYFFKAPVVPPHAPVVNAFFKQRLALENFFRAAIGCPPNTELDLFSYSSPRNN
jgi:myo-inositol-1-phosphate synthase